MIEILQRMPENMEVYASFGSRMPNKVESELKFLQEGEYTPDYWTRLEHQYAGMAMQGILSMPVYGSNGSEVDQDAVIECAMEYAHALVEKLKEKEERK